MHSSVRANDNGLLHAAEMGVYVCSFLKKKLNSQKKKLGAEYLQPFIKLGFILNFSIECI